MHIRQVTIRNLKSIQQLDLAMGNLTLIAGANSVGKSSFIQALLLIKQNQKVLWDAAGENGFTTVDDMTINGECVELGSKNSLLFIDAQNDVIEIGISNEQLTLTTQYDSHNDNQIWSVKKTDQQKGAVLPGTLINLFDHAFTYLNTNRTPPQMTYGLSDNDINNDSLGTHGEYTAHFLAVYKHRKLPIAALKHPQSVTDYLLENVSKWMAEISEAIDITASANENTLQATLTYTYAYGNNNRTKELSPLNVGFGVSYALPVITALLKAKPDDLIIIENPEAHLHPKGQANLARLIALVASHNVQVILETHSDHILNGIRVACKNGEIGAEQSKIYFFHKPANTLAVQAQEIKIDQDGAISDWPSGFFDEWDNQLDKLLW